ncbi:MAG: DUF3833 family protein [Ferruginibacter sp.]|nr:DUF3833 family protein [Ferruginibacter sp.]
MRTSQFIITTCILFLLAGCASMKPVAFEKSDLTLEPVQFFGGHTRSAGVIENRGGKPTARITTETSGVLKDSVLYIEQDLLPEGGKKNHRSWKLYRVDKHHVNATANDIDGTAHGLLYGDEFSWTFRLKLANRKFIKHARMSQHMYLMPDGETLIIRSVIRKFSFVVAQITEQFKKY